MSEPSESYLTLSQQPSILLTEPIKPLIILDLHGTLCSVVREPATRRTTGCYQRPKLDILLDYLMKYYEVAIWSSARPESVEFLSEMFKPKLENIKLIWTRNHFNLSKEDYRENVLTLKNLNRLWSHITKEKVYYPRVFNATNTILLDDSFKKCVLQPHNCVIVRQFEHTDKMFRAYGDNEIDFLIPYLERARHQSNIANWMRRNPYVGVNPAETTALNSFNAKYFGLDQSIQATTTSEKRKEVEHITNTTSWPKREDRKHVADSSEIRTEVSIISSQSLEDRSMSEQNVTTTEYPVISPTSLTEDLKYGADSTVTRIEFPIVAPASINSENVPPSGAKPKSKDFEDLFQKLFSKPISFS
ncbi:HAD-like domain-containing protein [Umbelopsis sp. PMI_123]|nr:HAD-like domain-containing protein [Umbelopsis sp. PMI_123]